MQDGGPEPKTYLSSIGAVSMTFQPPDIYRYLDFRRYLEDYWRARKRVEPTFSHAQVCRRLGQRGSKSYFANVIAGRKNVTPEFANRFIELLDLDNNQARYFRLLISYGQTCNPREKECYLEQLLEQASTSNHLLSRDQFEYFREWYHGVVRAALDLYDFDGDYKRLAAMVWPPISARQAQGSVQLLRSLGLIAENADGVLKPTDRTVRTPEYVEDDLVRSHQLQCLELARTALVGQHGCPQDFSTNVLTISEDGVRRLQAKLRALRDEVRALVQNDPSPADRVYQLDMQLFPNSTPPSGAPGDGATREGKVRQ